jgi:hypothetical protein
MPKTLPPFAVAWLAPYQPAQERYDLVSATSPSLDAAQAARLASQNQAGKVKQDLQAELAYMTNQDVRDPAAEKRQRAQIDQALQAQLVHEAATTEATQVSHGTRVASDRTAKMIEGTLAPANAVLELASPPKLPKSQKGLSARDIALAQRDALAANDDLAEATERALAPKHEVLALAQGQLAAEIHRGRISVTPRGRLVLPTTPLPVRPAVGSEVVTIPDVFAIAAALNAEQLSSAVEEAVERLFAGVPEDQQLSGPEKKRRLRKLKDERFEIELLEVEAIFAAWKSGDFSIGLRPDTDPLAVLGIRSWKPGDERTGSLVSIVERGKAFFGV